MPFGIVILLIQVTCAVHAVRTGKAATWLWIILLLPVVGSLIYIAVEIMDSREVRLASRRVSRKLTAERDFRRLQDDVEDMPTAESKRLLADELIERGNVEEAMALYRSALVPPHHTDPLLMLGLARCHFLLGEPAAALHVLDDLLVHNPDFRSREGHLLYARSLEGCGRLQDALAEYTALVPTYNGEEARVRMALLLQRLGRDEEADALIAETLKAVAKGSRDYARRNRPWLDMAKAARQGADA